MPAREEYPTAEAFLPDRLNLTALRAAAVECQGCPLYRRGTQTVFGKGPARAVAMFIGEQPGDAEDRSGEPFVGPAGKLLDEVLDEVGIDRGKVYVTNAVKHFKWEPRGNRRIHSKPSSREIAACKPWLTAELAVVRPRMVLCLGATAAQTLLGKDFRITRDRGRALRDTQVAPWVMATIHPSALLRITDRQERQRARDLFKDEMGLVQAELESG